MSILYKGKRQPDPTSVTPGRIRFTVDPATGDDDDPFAIVTETLESGFVAESLDVDTFIATTKTLQGTINRLHGVYFRHPVFVELPTGVITTDGLGPNTGRPELAIGGFEISEDWKMLDETNYIYDAPPGLYFRGSKSIQEDNRTTDVFGAAQIGDTTLAMTVDEYRGAVVEIYEGTGANQWRRCIRNTATTFQLLTSWGTTPDGTSKFRVWRAGSIIQGDVVVAGIREGQNFSGVSFEPTVKLDFSGGFGALSVLTGTVYFAGEIEGRAAGTSTKCFLVHSGSYATGIHANFGFDPLLERQPGMYIKNGFMHVLRSHCSMEIVADASRIEARERSQARLTPDMDGDKGGGVPTAGNGIRIGETSKGLLFKPAGAGATIRKYTYGATVDALSYCEFGGLDIGDCTDGIRLLSESHAEMRNVTGTGNSNTGASIRGQSTALIDRTGTTITGTAGNVKLGNDASGVIHPWSDCPINDALKDGGGTVGVAAGVAEWGLVMDRANS